MDPGVEEGGGESVGDNAVEGRYDVLGRWGKRAGGGCGKGG